MTHAALSQVLGTALVDDGFRRSLLRNPGEALVPFNLASDELTVLSRIRANTLEQFAQQLLAWFQELDGACPAG